MANNDSGKAHSDHEFQRANFIWDEYKYRHEHIWQLIFKITIAVIAVSIIPYTLTKSIENKVGHFIIALPIIGLALTIFSTLRMKKECSVLDKVRDEHRKFHESEYKFLYPDKGSTFTEHVIIYLISLIILGILNVGMVAINTFACK